MQQRHSRVLRAFALAALAACGGDTPVEPPPPPVPTQLTMVTQPAGSVANGVTLPVQPSVRLRDASGVPVAKAGVSVSVTLVGSGAVLSGTTTVTTDISGIAAFTGLKITGTVGSYTLRFASTGLTGADANAITLTPGAPTALTLATPPSTTAQAGTALAQQPSVQLQDQSGNNTPVANVTVTAALVSGAATLSNATIVTNASGVAVFSGLTLSGPVGTYTLRFSATGLTAVDAAPTVLAAGPATQVAVTTQPSANLVNGATLATQPVVELRDAFGNTATQAGVAVTASILSGTGTLSGTATVNTDSAGKATFTDLAITGTAGAFTLRFAAPSLAAAVSGTITLSAGAATKLGITTPPSSGTNGVALPTQPIVQVQDASGNAVPSAGIVVTATPVPAGPAVTNGTATTDAAGKATFAGLALTGTTGAYQIAFSASGLTTATSAAIALQPGAAAALVLTTQPDTVATNAVALARQPVARLQDASGNNTPSAGVKVTATLVSGTATLGSDTAVTNSSGIATFAGLKITGTTGTYTLRFTATGLPSVDASVTTRLRPGAATQLALTTQPPAAAQSGVALTTQPVVQLRDVSGNAVAQAGVTVTAAVATGSASVTNATAVTNAAGTATFSGLTLAGVPGSNTLSFSASGLTAATATAPTILTAGPAAAVTLTAQPAATAQSGIVLTSQPVVQLRDGTGNAVPQPGVTVTASVVSGSLTLANASATTDAAGAATFSGLTLTGLVGNYTLRFTAAGIGSVDAAAPTALGAGTAAAVTLTTQPSAAVQSGAVLATQPVVQLRDGAGNTVAQAGVAVTASLVSGSLTLANAAATTDAAGTAAFAGLTLTGAAGSYTLRFTATGVGSVNAAAATVVSAGPATSLAVQTQPSAFAVNGITLAQQPVVRVVDASGNLVTGSSTLVTATTSAGVTLANATATAVGGIATFSGLSLTGTPGSYLLSFSASGLAGASASAVTALAAGAPVAVTLTMQPSVTAQSGVALAQQPVAQLRDGSGNPVPQSGVVVTASLVSGSLVLLNATATTDGTGAATFSGLTLTGATGSYTLRFTATGIGSVTAAAATALGAGAATAVTLTTQPATSAQSGVALTTQPVLQLRDGTGNPVLQAGVTVTASLVSGSLTLGNASVMTDAGGTATFSALTMTGAVGSYSLRFTASGVGTVDALSATALSAGPAAQLALQTQPSTSTTTGVALSRQPVVRVLDGAGNLVTSSAAVITAGTTAGVTVTNQNATAVSGVATFSGLTLTGTAGSYTLTFTSAGLTGVSASAATVVGVGPAATLSFNTTPSTTAANGTVLAQQPIVVVKDASNNPITGTTVTVTADNGGTVLNGTATTNVSGVATFTALALSGTAQPYTLTFTSGAATNSAGVTLTAGAATTVTIPQQPSTSATNGAALATQPIVHVTDGTNPVQGAVVTASLTSAGATVGNATATTNASGDAAFSGLYLYGTAPASYTLQFTVGGVAPVAASSATLLSAGPAAKLVLTTQPSTNAQVGTALASQPVVQVTDAGGNVVTQSGTTVTAGVIGGGATLTGASATTSAGGAASFGSLAIVGTVGSYGLRFTAPGLDSVDAAAATTLAAGPATQLALTTQPATSAQSGVALTTQPAVQLRDEAGNAVAQSGVVVTASVVGGGATVGGASATTGVAGVASFTGLALSGPVGPYTLRFSASGLTSADAASATTITAGAPAALTVITEPPTTAVNAVALTTAPVVEVVDGAGNPVSGVALSAAASGSVVLSSASAVSAANGRATFAGLTLTGTAGAHTVQFCVGPCAGATIGVSAAQATTIQAGAPANIGVGTAPSGAAQSGVALASQPVVTVTDVSGNPVAGATVTASVAGAAVGGASVVTNASGVATFTALTVSGIPGSYTLQIATGTAATSSSLTLNVGPAASVTFSTAPSSTAQNGAVLAQQPVVLVKDGTGNPIAGASVTVTADNGGTVLNGTATSNGSGLATFTTLALTGTAGPYTLTFTAGAASTAAGFSLTAGAATTIAITQQPSITATNGAALATQPIVRVTDGTNGVQGLVVTASLTSAGASVANATAITDASGDATFSALSLSGAAPASYTLRFTVSGLAPVTAASATTLNPGPAAKLVLATQPSVSATNGIALASQPVVQITDAGGNVVLSSGTTVNAALVGGGPALTNAAASSASGVASFSGLTLTGAVGTYTLRFTAAGLDSVDAATATVLQPGPATQLALSVQPSAAATNGVPLGQQPVVRVLDASGNLVTSSSALVTASTTAGATLSNASVSAAGGIATFSGLTLTGAAGNYVLSFAASGVTGVSAASATVLSSGPASQLTLTTQPSTAANSGVTLLQQPVVQLRDASGNPVAQAGVAVTASVVSGSVTLGGLTASTNPSGTATFSGLTLSGPVGSYTLRFAAPGVTQVDASAPTSLAPGAPATLVIVTAPPATAVNGVALNPAPVIEVRDGAGNPVPDSTVTVSASGNVALTAASAVAQPSGQATFTGLTLTGTVAGYSLQFCVGPCATATVFVSAAQPIALQPGAPATMTVTTAPSASAQSGIALTSQPVVTVKDLSGNVVPGATVTATAGAAAMSGNSVVTDASGVAAFTALTVSGAPNNYTLQLASGAATSSSALALSVGPASSVTFNTTPSATVPAGSLLVQQPVVLVEDATGNPIAGITVAVTADGGATVLNGSATTDGAGIASFTALALDAAVGTYTLTFTAGPASTTSGISVTAGAANAISITTQPSTTASNGTALTTQPVVNVLDVSNNPVAGVVVTASLTAGGATVGNATATTDGSGNAAFSGLYLSGAAPASYTLQFTVSGLAPVTAAAATALSPGAAAKLVLTTQPSASATNGVALATQPVVRITDAGGNLVSSQPVTAVTATVVGGGPVLANATANSSGGIATFSGLRLTGVVGSYSLRFTAPGLDSVDASAPTVLTPGAVTTAVLTTQPAFSAHAGAALPRQPVLQLVDQSGNSVSQAGVAITATTPGNVLTLQGTTTVQTSAAGIATFTDLGGVGPAERYLFQFTSASPGFTVNAADSTVIAVPLTVGVPVSDSGHVDTEHPFVVTTQPGDTLLVVTIAGDQSSTADLAVRFGAAPNIEQGLFDCYPRLAGSNEECRFRNPTPGDWYVTLLAYPFSFQGVTVTVNTYR